MNSIARAVIAEVDDDKKMQIIKASILAGEVKEDIERMQEYGFTSVPLPGCEATIVFPSGNRDHGIIVATDDRRYRKLGLEPGEVALYTDEGDSVILKRGKKIEINGAEEVTVNTKIAKVNASVSTTIDSPITTMTGDLTVNGDIQGDKDITATKTVTGTLAVKTLATGGGGTTMKDIVDTYNTHTHNETDNAPNPTGAPNQTI